MLRHILTHRRLPPEVVVEVIAARGPRSSTRSRRSRPSPPARCTTWASRSSPGRSRARWTSRRPSSTCRVAAARLVERVRPVVSHPVNRLVPGRIRAESLVVANDQTRKALPKGYRGRVYEGISEVSVNLKVWELGGRASREPDGTSGSATSAGWSTGRRSTSCSTPSRSWRPLPRGAGWRSSATATAAARWRRRPRGSGSRDRVEFAGWVSAEEGARRLRPTSSSSPASARAAGSSCSKPCRLGLPVVATRWGGPGVHVNDATGIRVDPDSREGFIAGLADAMIRLALSPELRE